MSNTVRLGEDEKEALSKIRKMFNSLKFESIQHYGHFNGERLMMGGQMPDLSRNKLRITPDTGYVLNMIYSVGDNQGAIPLGKSLGLSLHVNPKSINDSSPGDVYLKACYFDSDKLANYYLDVFKVPGNKIQNSQPENVKISKKVNFFEAIALFEAVRNTVQKQISLSKNEKRYFTLALLGFAFNIPINSVIDEVSDEKKQKKLNKYLDKTNAKALELALSAFDEKYKVSSNQEELETSPFYKKLKSLEAKKEKLIKEQAVIAFDYKETRALWCDELKRLQSESSFKDKSLADLDEEYLSSGIRKQAIEISQRNKNIIENIKKVDEDIVASRAKLEKFRVGQVLPKNLEEKRSAIVSLLEQEKDNALQKLKESGSSNVGFTDLGNFKGGEKLTLEKIEKALILFDSERKEEIEKLSSSFMFNTNYRNTLTMKK